MSNIATVLGRIQEIERLQSEMAAELEELLVAKRVLARLNSKTAFPKYDSKSGDCDPRLRPETELGRSRPPRQTDYILKSLHDSSDPWMTSNEIQVASSILKGAEIPMSTVSPTLTELKDQGAIVRDGLKVALSVRVSKTSSPPSTEASGATESLQEDQAVG